VLVHFNFYICSIDTAVASYLFALNFVSMSQEIETIYKEYVENTCSVDFIRTAGNKD
jgi:hypothetical protein